MPQQPILILVRESLRYQSNGYFYSVNADGTILDIGPFQSSAEAYADIESAFHNTYSANRQREIVERQKGQ